MSYVRNREGIYRTGFRPVATNPYAATQLGLSPRPRHLGQSPPFTPGGGYQLHGLGNIVPNQAVVTWVGQVSGTATLSVQDVIAAASAALQSDGLPVVSQAGAPFALWDIDLSFSSSATITLQLIVNNGMGYGDPSDIAAIINHEIYTASGVMPTGAITNVTAPGGTATATAAGAAIAPSAASTNWSAWLQQNAMWIGLLGLGIFVLPDLLEKF
jgi:hypothetical protein